MLRKSTIAAAVAAGLGISAGSADAGPIRTFDLSGSFAYAAPDGLVPGPDLTGTLSIDIGTGMVTLAAIMFFDPAYSTLSVGSSPQGDAALLDVASYPAELFLLIDAPTLIGYAGGALGSLTAPTASGAFTTMALPLVPTPELVWGQAVEQTLLSAQGVQASVPEPVSAALFAAGLATLIFAREMLRRTPRRVE